MDFFDGVLLGLIGIGFQSLAARKDFKTWLAYGFSIAATLGLYSWAHGLPATLAHADVAPWGGQYWLWLGNTALGHKFASAVGLKTDSIGGSNARTPADTAPDPVPAAAPAQPLPAGS